MDPKLRQLQTTVNQHGRRAAPVSFDLAVEELKLGQRKLAEQLEHVLVMLDVLTGPAAPQEQLLTAKEICKELTISRGFLHTLRREGLPVLRLGSSSPRYILDDVKAWMKSRGQP
ncbi:MAG: hypothetical protein RLZZ450_6770 [Pseudomonadota bacterium]